MLGHNWISFVVIDNLQTVKLYCFAHWDAPNKEMLSHVQSEALETNYFNYTLKSPYQSPSSVDCLVKMNLAANTLLSVHTSLVSPG